MRGAKDFSAPLGDEHQMCVQQINNAASFANLRPLRASSQLDESGRQETAAARALSLGASAQRWMLAAAMVVDFRAFDFRPGTAHSVLVESKGGISRRTSGTNGPSGLLLCRHKCRPNDPHRAFAGLG
jgi:hypothetical protein